MSFWLGLLLVLGGIVLGAVGLMLYFGYSWFKNNPFG